EEVMTCRRCHAVFALVDRGTAATLLTFGDDPYRLGNQLKGWTLARADWEQIGRPSAPCWVCKSASCQASLERYDEKRIVLVKAIADPFDVAKRYAGKPLFDQTWVSLSMGLPPDAGNRHCPQCGAEFQYDESQGSLKLRRYNSAVFPWIAEWCGKAVALRL